nr:hypothetical protein [candidate division Zixibacteria bacterium]
MEIGLIYSKQNADHQKAVTFVRRAVENLGISATITEHDHQTAFPHLVVNGFDLTGMLQNPANCRGKGISYDRVEKIIEQIAW